jgi:hypothetical protein
MRILIWDIIKVELHKKNYRKADEIVFVFVRYFHTLCECKRLSNFTNNIHQLLYCIKDVLQFRIEILIKSLCKRFYTEDFIQKILCERFYAKDFIQKILHKIFYTIIYMIFSKTKKDVLLLNVFSETDWFYFNHFN